jgi:hypothetical protein
MQWVENSISVCVDMRRRIMYVVILLLALSVPMNICLVLINLVRFSIRKERMFTNVKLGQIRDEYNDDVLDRIEVTID